MTTSNLSRFKRRYAAFTCTATTIMLILASLASPALALISIQFNCDEASLTTPLPDASILARCGSTRKSFSDVQDHRLSTPIEGNIRCNPNTEQAPTRLHYFITSARHLINIRRLQLNI